MKSIRLQDGVDCWTCRCGAVNLSGHLCRCGKSYADLLAERYLSAKSARKSSHKVHGKPAAQGQFTESYCFKKEPNNG